MSSNENLDLILGRKKPFSIDEFQKIISDDKVSSVGNVSSDKKLHLCYEVKLLNGKIFKVYVKMSVNYILREISAKHLL